MKSNMKKNWSGRSSVVSISVGLIATVIALLIISQRVLIIDSVRAWMYQPPADIRSIEQNVVFSPTGTRLFYANAPELVSTSKFNSDCQSTEKTTVVIGCYVGGRIYLYDVTNDELNGVEEVTAAHEVLHAAYDRLSSPERNRVNGILEDQAKVLLKDSDFKERMSVYDELDGEDRINELHSVIGTEVSAISAELETYFSQYFDDRARVVGYYQQYHSIFAKIEKRAKDLADSLDAQAASINARINTYNQNAERLDKDITTFNKRAKSGYFTTQQSFEAERTALVARSDALDKEKTSINAAISKYNSDKETFDSMATHLTELNNSIDSSLAPSPTVSE